SRLRRFPGCRRRARGRRPGLRRHPRHGAAGRAGRRPLPPAPVNLKHLPNAITGLRLAMAPVLLWLLWAGFYREALWVALVAGASDAVDGLLAKRFGWQSRLGSLLDPVADKALLGCAFVGLWLAGALPTWLVALVVARDLVILGGAMVWWRVAGPYDGEP